VLDEGSGGWNLKAILALARALRPKQWVKNVFCLAPLVFSRQALELDSVDEAALVFLAFSLLASAVYLVNDVIDRDSDRAHPVKRNRPIASGALGVGAAIGASVLIGAAALGLGAYLSYSVLAVLGTYLVLNVGYAFWLKHLALVDIFVISIGFVLRVMAGAAAIDVFASQWILTCTLFLSLVLATCKRRSEVELQGQDSGTRKVLSSYSLRYLDLVIAIAAAGAILSYALYTLSPSTVQHLGTTNLIYTLPFAVFAILRYIYLVLERAQGESPFELLVRDASIIVSILGYIVVTVLALYVLGPGGQAP
jgi:4-hydroxybenzoate polyprenyltransferase